MQNTFEIGHLSKEDKLTFMEAIWEDLSKDDEEIESPGWHHDVLQNTERRLQLDEEKTVDWIPRLPPSPKASVFAKATP